MSSSGLGPESTSGKLHLGPVLVAASSGMCVLTLASAVVHCIFWYRRRLGQMGWSKFMVAVAVIFALASVFLTAAHGISASSHPHFSLRLRYAAQPCLALSTALAQTALCLHFQQAFPRAPASLASYKRMSRGFLVCLLTLILGPTATLLLTTSLQCRPLARAWDPHVAGSCIATRAQTGGETTCTALGVLVFVALAVCAARARTDARIKTATVVAMAICVLLGGVQVCTTAVVGARPPMGDELLAGMLVSVVATNVTVIAANVVMALSLYQPPSTPIKDPPQTEESLTRKIMSCISLPLSDMHYFDGLLGGSTGPHTRSATPVSVASYNSEGIVKT
ncbi:hypothetical protein CFIMG_008502RA00001 [Ceratocystis fimbriata CBS 114723]|uniref:Rhodopsin domain-containing protein n=1 Tax=Ceratocystis fimbriata CBS 114723 TaxID=1035309 RepID=A0A2C5X3W4_9PEZI|nr:hypothetical protein CFIMG_008502RA00001 [Ceratocystis fimbriata CBS 114723]